MNPRCLREGDSVQVLIRVRPINKTELQSDGFKKCLEVTNSQTLIWTSNASNNTRRQHYSFDHVSQDDLFEVAGAPLVQHCMAGYNGCMFAYGQTGSGKTHTMFGDIAGPTDKWGMIPRMFEYLFQLEEERRKDENVIFLTKCSFLEIFHNHINDLLEPTSTNLRLRALRKGVHVVEKLTQVVVNNVQDVIQLLIQGLANRKVASTNMNKDSSRSHSVFTCIVESKSEEHVRLGRLNLIDLAGSERPYNSNNGANVERDKEAKSINLSLTALGSLIRNISDFQKGKATHINYRGNKLTELLQEALGGNSRTLIVAAVSPSSKVALETSSTLKFAAQAKNIRNMAIIDETASVPFGDSMVEKFSMKELQLKLDSLEAVLDEERAERKELGHELERTLAHLEEERSLRRAVEVKVARLTEQLQEAERLQVVNQFLDNPPSVERVRSVPSASPTFSPMFSLSPVIHSPIVIGEIKKTIMKWTEDQEIALLQGIKNYGMKWSKIKSSNPDAFRVMHYHQLRDKFKNIKLKHLGSGTCEAFLVELGLCADPRN